jgi:uncharacterized heparinase superfamily protein
MTTGSRDVTLQPPFERPLEAQRPGRAARTTPHPGLRRHLRDGLAAWRRLGPFAGARAVTRLVRRRIALRGRGIWLRWHPLSVSPNELCTELGGLTATAALRDSALQAMPTVRDFEASLGESATAHSRAELIARAEPIMSHVFNLLGSGPTELGLRIDWQRDFKTGRSWPLKHRSRLTISYPDDSDIKVPWELSRFQHLPLLAAAFRLTGEQRYLDEIGAQLRDWIDANPVEFGVNWACTMDVAIRATNWVAALALLTGDERGATAPWIEEVLASLLLHGRFIRSHLEWAQVRGNHYLSDVVGLLAVAAVFSRGAEGRAWAVWAAQEVAVEIEHQVHEDGCDHEASIPYHRLATELFICGLQSAEALVPASVPSSASERLDRMLSFTAAYTRPDGLAPQIGDADDGRFLPLGDYGTFEHRRHDHLFEQAGRHVAPSHDGGNAAFPHGGWFVMRSGSMHMVIRCGEVGVGGLGCHAHCDQLAFELSFGEQPLIVDPGSYLYTADLAARAAFRSTAVHATLEIEGAEQNPIHLDRPFQMEDCTRAELLTWTEDGARATFAGRHHGYERLEQPATHERQIDFDGDALTVTITDTVRSDGSHPLRWSLPIASGEVELNGGAATVHFPTGVCLSIEAPKLRLELADGWYSPSYGVRHPAPILRAERDGRPGEDVTVFTLRIQPAGDVHRLVREPGPSVAVPVRASVVRRGKPWSTVAAFCLAFAGTLIVALLQGVKIFYYDSGQYWQLGETFIQNGHFSLLNFQSSVRGYVLPLVDHALQTFADALAWNPSSLAKVFNVLIFALIGTVLGPALAKIAWPAHRWGPVRRVTFTALLIVFWSGYLNFPLSDFPALAMALLALVAVAHPDTPGWMLIAGAACGLAIDMRTAYLLLAPILVVLMVWAWLDRRGAHHASIARRALCAGMLTVGFVAVSLPQSLSAHRYYGTWSFVPGPNVDVASTYLTPGMQHQRYDTYVGPGEPNPAMYYDDEAGLRLLHEQKDIKIASTSQYLGLIASHPTVMGGLLARHIINGLDPRFSTPYVEHLHAGLRPVVRFVGFLLVFLALVRVLWPAARRRLGPARWRYLVALALCCLTSVPSPMETRYMLSVYLISYILVLAPGWPSPIGSSKDGVRRLRTPAILIVSYLVFMAVVWHVISEAGSHIHFG